MNFSTNYISQMVDTGRSKTAQMSIFFILVYYLYLVTFILRLLITSILLNNQNCVCLIESVHLLRPVHRLPPPPEHPRSLIVTNKIHFFELNFGSWKKMAFRLFSLWRQTEKVRVTSRPLTAFNSLQPSIRRRAALLSFSFDFILAFSFYFCTLFFALANLYIYVYFIWDFYSFEEGLIIIFEITLLEYATWHSCKISFFFEHLSNLLIYVLTAQQAFWSAFLTSKYLPAHRSFLSSLVQANRDLVSTYYFFSLVTIFPFNAYTLTMILLKEMSTSLRLQFTVYVFMEDFFLLLALRPVITAERAMKIAGQQLSRSKAYLPGSSSNSTGNIRLKVKLDEISKLNFAFTAGSFGSITTNSVLKFIFVYAGFMMFFWGNAFVKMEN
ncbi:hypothetical protein TYRP_021084 [Tyrophagus putrescentiae]|nr:hypothetical protein TYRP_021084 [Tyrophagus putrescentiae]